MTRKPAGRPDGGSSFTPASATRLLVALAFTALTSCRGAGDSVSAPLRPGPATPIAAPVNTRIAFVSTRDGAPYIYLTNGDGSITRLTQGEKPAWSWDGRKIAFEYWSSGIPHDGVLQVRVINADGSGEQVVAANASAPAWSPDGTRIVFTSLDGGGIFAINADGSGLTRLLGADFDDPGAGDGLVTPTFSPDGRSIAFGVSNWEKVSQIFVMNADGSAPRRLTVNSAASGPVWSAYGPVWSPDGSMIALVSQSIGTINADGSGFRIYPDLNAFDLDWSPDGRSLIFGAFTSPAGELITRGSRTRIWVLDRTSGAVRQLIPEAIAPVMADYADASAVWARANP